ncbi:UbiH/UbiF family hydroxylase [Oricola thermophila]|nr:UbiH/UbiF family hydroxylase [Oricola thermophila]
MNDIAIVGGGPAGMAAALEAARHGYEVVLVAPSGTFLETDERTTAVMMPGIRLLQELGAWPELADEATPMRTMRLVDGTSRLVRAPTVTFQAHEIDEEAFGYNIVNRVLNAALQHAIDASPRIRVVDAMAETVSFGPDAAKLALSDGETLQSSLIVAADGVKSLMRETAGIGTRTWNYPQTAIVLTFAHGRDHHFVSTEFHRETGPFAQVPMRGGKRSSLVWVERPQEAERIATLDSETLAGMIERKMQSMLGAVSDVSRPQCWPLSGMIANRFGAERLMLIGQAAHIFPPIGAQGLNLSLRDIADLGKCLESAGADPGAVAVTSRYDRMRRLDVTTRTGTVDLLNRSLLTGFLPVQLARAVGLGLLAAMPPLRHIAMREGLAPGAGLRSMFSRPLREIDRVAAGRSSWRTEAR